MISRVQMSMTLNLRPYQSENDFWRVRAFLRQAILLDGLRQRCWHVARWDYWRWHGVENLAEGPLEQTVYLWETSAGDLAAVLNPEGRGQAFLQIHPDYRIAELVRQMLDLAEQRLASERSGHRQLSVWALASDALLCEELLRRGYTLDDDAETQRWRTLEAPLPEAPPAVGYSLRSLGEAGELPARSWASWRAFHPGTRQRVPRLGMVPQYPDSSAVPPGPRPGGNRPGWGGGRVLHDLARRCDSQRLL
jgi:hypothetical protein